MRPVLLTPCRTAKTTWLGSGLGLGLGLVLGLGLGLGLDGEDDDRQRVGEAEGGEAAVQAEAVHVVERVGPG